MNEKSPFKRKVSFQKKKYKFPLCSIHFTYAQIDETMTIREALCQVPCKTRALGGKQGTVMMVQERMCPMAMKTERQIKLRHVSHLKSPEEKSSRGSLGVLRNSSYEGSLQIFYK